MERSVLIPNRNQLELQHVAEPDLQISSGSFIEANTKQVDLGHLKGDTIIPVFAKDNESTISHAQFIESTKLAISDAFSGKIQHAPNIRVSHVIKGRTPEAIGKPVKDLMPYEKTIYYERMAFMIELPEIREQVNNSTLGLVIGGVRAYNQENLYSKKTMEKFKVFIGFKNWVCTNLCVSTDGLIEDLRVAAPDQLTARIYEMITQFDADRMLGNMERLSKYYMDSHEFAHLVGRLKMFQYLPAAEKKRHPHIGFNDSQISQLAKDYHRDEHFGPEEGGLNLWNLYNLFTAAGKSSYIDAFLKKQACAYELSQELANSLENGSEHYLLHNYLIAKTS